MSLARDAASPSSRTRSLPRVKPGSLQMAWGGVGVHRSASLGEGSHCGSHVGFLFARQLCVLQLCAPQPLLLCFFFFPFPFPPKPGISILGVKGGGKGGRGAGDEAGNCQSSSDMYTEPSRLIQHKVAAEEILPSPR